MLSSLPHKVLLTYAAILSLLAQGVLLTSMRLRFFPQFIPSWGSVAFGASLFMLSMYIYVSAIRSISMKNSIKWQSNGILLFIQVFTIPVVYFIFGNSASRLGQSGFFLTGMITALTTYGIF